MFEDIIGGVNKKNDAKFIYKGNGITTCPACSSINIVKGQPLYLINKNTSQRCECNACHITWSLIYDPSTKKYEFTLHAKVVV